MCTFVIAVPKLVRSAILATKRSPCFRFLLSRLLSVNDSTFPDYVEKSHEFSLGVFNSPRHTLCAASGAINAAARSGISSWCDCVGIHLTPIVGQVSRACQ